MKKLKYEILFIILFMTVGIAAVSTNVFINGSTPIASNPDDFNVYFSGFLGTEGDVEISFSSVTADSLVFSTNFDYVGQIARVEFFVTNASKNYDASVSLSCVYDDEYFDVSSYLGNVISARDTSYGYIDIKLLKSYIGESEYSTEVTCTINSNALERTTLNNEEYVDESINLHSFIADGKTYLARENMTWLQWVYSSYNTDGFDIDGDYVVNSAGDIIDYVSPSDVIEFDKEYKVVYTFDYIMQYASTGEIIYSATLSFYKGMTWSEWVETDFNIAEASFRVVGEYVYNGNYLKVGPMAIDEIIKDYSYIVYYS